MNTESSSPQILKSMDALRKLSNVHPLIKYVVAVLLCLPALALANWYQDSVGGGIFLFGLFVVVLSAWYGNSRCGIVTTVAYALMADIFLLEPRNSLSFSLTTTDAVHLTLFISLGLIISWLHGQIKYGQQQVESRTTQLNTILRNIVDGITVRSSDGKAIFYNETAARLSGYATPEAALNTPLSKTMAQFELRDRYGSPLPMDQLPNFRALKEKSQFELTYQRLSLKSSESVWINHKASPVLKPDGEVDYVINIFRDVTTERERENALRNLNAEILEQNQRYKAVWSNMPGIVWETRMNNQGVPTAGFISPYLEKMLGYSVAEWTSNPSLAVETLHPDDRDRALQELVNFKDGADSLMVEYRSIAKDGRVVQMETYVSIVRDSAGIPQAVYGVTLDVTARKQAESDLERQTDELRRSNEELQRFAYVASHDLQEPLRMVTSYLQLLEQRYKSQLDQDAQDFIGYAVDGSARMKSLINDLLMYSRVGSRARAFESFPAQRAADQAIRNLEMSINETGAKVTIGELPEIVGDELQFVQLFQNLVGNAIKFRSDKTPEIKISAEPKDKNWLFAVQDNGIGMESEYLGRIFVIFQRLHNREQYEGTGIGLAICKKIVERHGGNIWADSQVGQGTTFYFEIPIRSTRS